MPGKQLTKQEGVIVDTTGSIKVVFWESFIDNCEEGKTYEYKNFSYKVDKYGIYISSTKEGSAIREVDDLAGDLKEC